jgi:enoyl-CoA hydratase/carnithine racemase
MLRITDTNRVRTLTLDRPEALNAFDTALYDALAGGLRDAAADPTVAVVVLTATGRAFSAGQDLGEMAGLGVLREQVDAGETSADQGMSGFPALLDALATFDKPLIAAVNGLGVGIGFTILAHCDLALVSSTARFRAPFCPLGVAPEAASSLLFPQQMGWQRASWVLFSGAWVSAEEAVELGVAWKVCEPERLLDEALEVAATFARWPIPSLVATKRAMLHARSADVREARATEDAAFVQLVGTPANIEAVTAFLEKRDPDFSDIPGA